MSEIPKHIGERKIVKSVLEDFNLQNFIAIVKKSLLWCLLFVLITFSLAYLYLKYTQPIYISNAMLMMTTQKQTRILGVAEILADDKLEIDKEIQLIKSSLILKGSLDSTDLSVEYYTQGKIGRTILYKTNPFSFIFNNYTKDIFNKELEIVFEDPLTYKIAYNIGKQEYSFQGKIGKEIKTPHFSGVLKNENKSNNLLENKYIVILKNYNDIISVLSRQLVVTPLDNRSKTLNISIEASSPQKAHDIVSSISNYFIWYDAKKKAESIDKTIEFLDKQIIDFGNEYSYVQDSMKQFKIETGFITPSKQISNDISTISSLEKAKLDIELGENSLNWLVNYLKSDNDLNSLTGLVLTDEAATFQNSISQINNLQAERNQKLLNVTPDHPDIILLNSQIQSVKENLLSQINLVKSKNTERVKEINKEIERTYGELFTLPDKETEYLKVKRENDLREQFYFNLVEKKNMYLISKAGILSDYILLKPATFSNKFISPNITMIKILGLASGLMLGILLIAIRYLLFNKVTTVDEIEENTNSKFIGIVPKHNIDLEVSKVVTVDNPKSAISESFRSIRSNLEFINAEDKPKVITTTSTVPGEGKTFVGVNLAAIYSLLNKKVVILDFDLRKPRISQVFNVESQKGISTILIGKTTIQECIYNAGHKNLDFITAGPVPPNPSELISSKATKNLIEDLKKEYDYIFIDTPPVGIVTDGLEMLKKADYPIYVVRANYSERPFLENINKLIFDNEIYGLTTVLNDFSVSKKGYYGNYGYGYGYSGGYYSDDVPQKEGFFKTIVNKLFK